jgi:hypothetical protein
MSENAPQSAGVSRWTMNSDPAQPRAATIIRLTKRTPVPDNSEVDDFGPSAGTCDSTVLMVDLRSAFPIPTFGR